MINTFNGYFVDDKTFKITMYENDSINIIKNFNIINNTNDDDKIGVIKNNLAKNFNTNIENIKLYSDTIIDNYINILKKGLQMYHGLLNIDNSIYFKEKNFTRLMNSMIVLIQINNDVFYIKRTKISDIYIPTSNSFNIVIKNEKIYDMYNMIVRSGNKLNDIDKIFARYEYKIDSDECIAELQYYLSGNYFIELWVNKEENECIDYYY